MENQAVSSASQVRMMLRVVQTHSPHGPPCYRYYCYPHGHIPPECSARASRTHLPLLSPVQGASSSHFQTISPSRSLEVSERVIDQERRTGSDVQPFSLPLPASAAVGNPSAEATEWGA